MAKSKRQIEAAAKKAAAAQSKASKKASEGSKLQKEEEVKEEKIDLTVKKVTTIIKDDGEYRNATGVLESRPTSKDVKIGGFTLTAYGRELIKNTMLEFTIGRRYGLIGQNGSGKTTLLKCIAAREIPIPDVLDLFYLDQEAPPSDKTAIEYVIESVKAEVTRLEKLSDYLLENYGPDDEKLAEVYDKLEDFDPATFESRAGALLFGLGFSKETMRKATKDMSGGWRMRVALAEALFIRPSLLLLDEPTNHLDLEACVWLEEYLATYPHCLLVISHSQDFLNTVCTNIIHLTTKGELVGYTGNYDMYCQTKKENEVNQMTRYKKEQEDIKHLKTFIASCGTYSNLVKQAKSKEKLLNKMYEKGLTQPVEPPVSYKFAFPETERLSPPCMAFEKVAFSYSGKKSDHLYEKVDLAVDMDSRVAIVGPNGAGKSTLLKLMTGALLPTEGQVRKHLHLKLGKYDQHSNDQLDEKKSPLQFIRDTYETDDSKMEEEDWRKAIGRYGVSGKQQTMPIGTLSDGIKSRIVFAMLALEKPNVLLLDEPTNHLDLECIDALAAAIQNFSGGVVLVSHDFRLLSQVAKEVWVCDNHTITKWDGDIRSYKNFLVKRMRSSANNGLRDTNATNSKSAPTKDGVGFKKVTI